MVVDASFICNMTGAFTPPFSIKSIITLLDIPGSRVELRTD